MKKTIASVWSVVLISLLLGGISSASSLTILEDNGQKIVWDATNSKYWYWDVHHWAGHNYDEQIKMIADELSGGYFQGTTGWHMAYEDEYNIMKAWDFNEAISVFGFQYGDYTTSGRIDVIDNSYPNSHLSPYYESLSSSLKFGWVEDNNARPSLGAWVVTEGTAPVPEPATVILFGLGLLGFAGVSRKNNNRKSVG